MKSFCCASPAHPCEFQNNISWLQPTFSTNPTRIFVQHSNNGRKTVRIKAGPAQAAVSPAFYLFLCLDLTTVR